MQLRYRSIGEGKPLIILHGVFGTSDNWQTFGKAVSAKYKVYLVDLRNHGNSPHSDTFDYPSMAEDLKEFIEEHHLDKPMLMGHSMGGKVVMSFAVAHPDSFEKMIIVDIAPKYYPPHHQKILEGLSAVKIDTVESRKEAEEQLSAYIDDTGIRQFLLKNLKRADNGQFAWKLNLSVVKEKIDNVGLALDTDAETKKPALFIRGDQSEYVLDEDKEHIRKLFPLAQIITIKDAGHWIHAEQPEALYEAVTRFLD